MVHLGQQVPRVHQDLQVRLERPDLRVQLERPVQPEFKGRQARPEQLDSQDLRGQRVVRDSQARLVPQAIQALREKQEPLEAMVQQARRGYKGQQALQEFKGLPDQLEPLGQQA